MISEGDTYEETLANINSAIQFHIETFGDEAFEMDAPILETFIAETGVSINAQAPSVWLYYYMFSLRLCVRLVFSVLPGWGFRRQRKDRRENRWGTIPSRKRAFTQCDLFQCFPYFH